MGPFYRVLGLTAFLDSVLGSFRVYYLIRANWVLFAALSLSAFAGASSLGLPWPRLPLEIPLAYPGLQTSLSLSALALLATCWVKRDTIFRRMSVGRGADGSPGPKSLNPGQIDLRISGRFDRGLGHPFTLRDVRVRWNIDDTGSILLETYLETIGGFGVPPLASDNSGPWSLIVPRETLTECAEEGILYFGLSARPAFRLRLPGRGMTAILSVRDASQLRALRRLFDALAAESAAKEAGFFRLGFGTDPGQPLPTQSIGPTERQEKPGEEVPWNSLIDFSQ